MSKFKTMELNLEGNDYIVGDIHGCFERLENTLWKIGFSKEKDRLFCVGDLIDRGMDSPKALEWLEYPWFHCIAGNHEALLMGAYLQDHEWETLTADQTMYPFKRVWFGNGGEWAMNISLIKHDFKKWNDAFAKLPVAIEIPYRNGKSVGLVHAEVPMGGNWQMVKDTLEPIPEDDAKWCLDPCNMINGILWGREKISKYQRMIQFTDDPAVENLKTPGIEWIVCGHTPTQKITTVGNNIYCDLGMCFDIKDYFKLICVSDL